MILSIPRSLGGGCRATAILVALLVASESGGCSRPHSSSANNHNYNSCGSFFGIVGVDAFTLPTSRTTTTPLYSSYLDSITASVVPSKKKSYSPSSSSGGKSNAAVAGDTPPPNFRSFSSFERTERKLRGTLGQLPIREDHLQSLISDDVDYDTPELGDLFSNQGHGDVEATLGRLVNSALSSINTFLPDDIYYDGRSDDGALLKEWLSDPTNKRALARRAHFDIGSNGLPDDDRRGFGDIAAEERQIGKWTAYLTDPAVASAMVSMALDDKLTYFADDFVAGDISDEYRVLTSLEDYLTDPSSARALVASALDGIPTALPDDSLLSQENDAATILRKWLDADPDNARRALVGFADDKLGYLSDDMAAHAALPGYESVDEVMGRYKNDPTTFRGPNSKASQAFAGDKSFSVLSDDANVGEELLQSLSSYLADPTNVQRLAGFGGGPSINPDDSSYLPGYENLSKLLARYCQDPTTISKAAYFGGAASAAPDDDNIGEALKDIVSAWLSDPTNANAALQEMGVHGNGLLPDDFEYSADEAGLLWLDKYLTDGDGRLNLSQWLSTDGNLERILSDDKWSLVPDDDARDLGHMSAQSHWGGNDPTNPSAKSDAYASGIETPKGFSLYYGSGTNMKRVSSVGNDKLLTMYPDDKFYLPGYESPKDDPTTFRAKSNGYEGLETPKNLLFYGRNSAGNASAAVSATGPASSFAKQADGDPGATFMADDDGRGLNHMPAPGPQGGGVSSPVSAASTVADGGLDGHTLYPDCSEYGAYGDALKRSQRNGGKFYYGRHVRDDY